MNVSHDPAAALRLSRRALLRLSAGGLLLGVGARAEVDPMATAADAARPLGLFLRIANDGAVTVIAPSLEMGQGATSAHAQIVADELRADWSRVSVQVAPLNPAYRGPVVPLQQTSGSMMVRHWHAPLRRSAAAAREMLTLAAARRWGVDVATCKAENGRIVCGERSAGFGELADDAGRLPVPANPTVLGRGALAGRSLGRLDVPSKVDGSARYGIDVRLPGLVYAAIRQAPVFGSRLVSVDGRDVEARPGVLQLVKLPDAVAVVATSFWRAKTAAEALAPQFTETPQSRYTSQDIAHTQRLQLDAKVARTAVHTGRVLDVLAQRGKPVTADYDVPYLHHATMEPMTCTVRLSADLAEVWVPTQNVTGVGDTAARLTGLPLDRIRVHAMLMGGGFGRKFEQDFVEQAVLIAKAASRPVQLIWTREEDVQHGRYRPAMTARLRAVTDTKGDIDAMSLRVVGPSIGEFRGQGIPFTNGYDVRAVLGVSTETESAPARLQQYAVPNFMAEVVYAPAHVPVGSWRAVGASENGFFIESFIDELAVRAKRDPYAFRHHHLRDSPRALAVLERVATAAGWGRPLPKGHARGIAFSECVGSLVAQVAEVSLQGGTPRVHRIVCAIDCGTALNPMNVRAQVEGAIVMGLSAAMQEEITIAAGACVQSNFHDYPVARMSEVPAIEVHLIESGAALGGVGEAALPAVAPAVCNALFALTKRRIRSLPIRKHVFA